MYLQVDVPMERHPIANWGLIAVTVVCSILTWAGHEKSSRQLSRIADAQAPTDPAIEKQLNNPRLPESQKEKPRDKRDEIQARWFEEQLKTVPDSPLVKYSINANRENFRLNQLITHLFIHADFWHLLGNMLFLFCFGNAVNAKLGHFTFLGLYLGLGVIAGIGCFFAYDGLCLGASGAISGITGLFLVFYPINEIALWTIRSMMYTGDAWRFPSWVFIILYMALDLVGVLMQGQGVAYVAHLVGEFLGAVIGFALVMAHWVRAARGEKFLPEIWGWVKEEVRPRRRRRKKRRRDLPPPTSEAYP